MIIFALYFIRYGNSNRILQEKITARIAPNKAVLIFVLAVLVKR